MLPNFKVGSVIRETSKDIKVNKKGIERIKVPIPSYFKRDTLKLNLFFLERDIYILSKYKIFSIISNIVIFTIIYLRGPP